MTVPGKPVEDLLRELAPQVLGVLARRSGDFDAAEDAVQESLLSAATHWPADGIPANPRGWLLQTASRKLLDHVRSEAARRHREIMSATRDVAGPAYADDDTLDVLFLCCHPALSPGSAIALTLRAVGGLTTAEIAHAFLVPEATMAQRISRAKQKIKGLPLPPADGAERLRSVRHVLYLIFNEGYAASIGPHLVRTDLAGEAIRLARMLHRLVPGDTETAGLLALMLLTDARRDARTDTDGELVALEDQDRRSWDQARIAEGTAILDAAVGHGMIGEYQVQAAIAALHDRAPSVGDTDWPQIFALYGLLERMTGNPIVTLNRAVAAAMVDGPAAGLRLAATLDDRLAGHYRLDAVRAHLHELAGDLGAAETHYRAAAARTASVPEQRYLTRRAATLHARRTR